jgi:hypothetical protein
MRGSGTELPIGYHRRDFIGNGEIHSLKLRLTSYFWSASMVASPLILLKAM